MKIMLCTLTLVLIHSGLAWSKRIVFPYAGRNFTLVIPDKTVKKAPLLVALHGCKQSSKIFLDGSGLDEVAEKNNFFVLSPEQSSFYNIDNCWNWFLGTQQGRFMANEMAQIIAGIDLVLKQYPIDDKKIFIAGMSAGGAMSHNLTACYPEYFSGSAIHSGLTYKSAENIIEAQTILTSYDQKSPDYLGKKMFECSKKVSSHKMNRVIIIHGQEDSRVPSLHAELIQKTQAVWRDYLDDGIQNDSVRGIVKRKTTRFSSRYKIEQTDTLYPNFTERLVLIHGLGHAWGGGKPISVNFDPKAPSSNDFILKYFDLIK